MACSTWFVIAIAIVVAGCGGGGGPVHGSISGSLPMALPEEWVACARDADCHAIEMDCCDHCNGGWVLAVNTSHVARATSAYHASCDSREQQNPDGTISFCGPSCTEVGCGPIGQRCDRGRCVWTWDAEINGKYFDQPNVVLPARIPHGPACGT